MEASPPANQRRRDGRVGDGTRRSPIPAPLQPLVELILHHVSAEVCWSQVAIPQRVYHTLTSVFWNVEIKTTEELSSPNNLVLVHPWLQCLLDPAVLFEDDAEPFTPVEGSRDGDPDAPFTNPRPSSSSYTVSSSHHTTPQLDKLTRSLRFFVRVDSLLARCCSSLYPTSVLPLIILSSCN